MESLYDVRTLMEGGKIPLIKDRESWHYSLQNALQGGSDPTGGDRGLAYEDYLRILLWCRSNEELAKLGMNMVEADIRLTPGNTAFRLDGCIVSLGVQLRIHSQYGTDVQLQSHKSY